MIETLLVAAIAIGIVMFARPGVGLGVLIAVTLLWPEYVRVPMGVAQMSAPRFVAMALVLRHLGRWSKLHQHPADWLVLAGYFLSVVAVIAEGASSRLITSTVGRLLDTVLLYAAARLCLATYEDVKAMRWPLVITAFGVGTMAGIESVTKSFLFGGYYFGAGNTEISIGEGRGGVGQFRWGMMRAQVTTAHPIYFGVAMTIVLGFALTLRRALPRILWWGTVLMAAVGVFFSLSSGAWTPAFLLFLLLPLARWSWVIKPGLGALGLLCIAVEVLSTRHFYYMICYIGLSNETAWYRVRLLEVAFQYLPDYWLFGYGDRSWEHWGLSIDGRFFIDCVNNYIFIAAMNGIFTMACYLLAKIVAVWGIAKAWKRLDRDQRWVAFVLAAAVVSVALAECSVSVFGPALILNAVLLGATASAARWGAAVPVVATMRVTARRPTNNRRTLGRRDRAEGLGTTMEPAPKLALHRRSDLASEPGSQRRTRLAPPGHLEGRA